MTATAAKTTIKALDLAQLLEASARLHYTVKPTSPEGQTLEGRMARAAGARYAASLTDRHSAASLEEAAEMLETCSAAWAYGFIATAQMILGQQIG